MDEENKPKSDQPQSPQTASVEESQAGSAPPAAPATAQHLTRVEAHMSGYEKSTLRWARTAVILSALAALVVCAQWWEMHEGGIDTKRSIDIAENTLIASNQPWVAFDVASRDGGIGIDNDSGPFKVASDGKTATIGLHYWLSNSGRYPANVRINAEILDETAEQVQDHDFEPSEAQRLCDAEKSIFPQEARRWAVVPGIPMPYGFTYDGDLAKENHLPIINLRIADPSDNQPHDLTNLGCIVYQSSDRGDSKLHQTPFLAKIKIRVNGPSINEARGLLIIGEAN